MKSGRIHSTEHHVHLYVESLMRLHDGCRGCEEMTMDVRAEIDTRVRARDAGNHEGSELHPARGILLAIGLSALGWILVLAVVLSV